MTKTKTARWFSAGAPLNWRKADSQSKRRTNALSARNGDLLGAARALVALANVTSDGETERKARADAKHFFALHRRQKSRKVLTDKVRK